MICIFLSIVATVIGSAGFGFIVLFFLWIEPIANFIYTQIPIAKFATMETFLELGVLINFILIKLFGQRRTSRNFASFIGIVIILALVIPAMYYSFSSPFSLLTNDIPVFSDFYTIVLKFFTNIVNHLKEFFIG